MEGNGIKKYAIIGGTSLLKSKYFEAFSAHEVSTKHGNVVLYEGENDSAGCYFVQRHHADADKGAEVYNPPHEMNQKAYVAALKQLGVSNILAVCSVGSLNLNYPMGTIIVPDDYFSLTSYHATFYDNHEGHMVPELSSAVRKAILESLSGQSMDVVDKGVYVQTIGPRFETKAEIRFLATVGDVVGMTSATEAVLAQEMGLNYAMLCMVDNLANGLGGSALSEAEFRENVVRNQETVEKAVGLILQVLPKV